MLLDYVKVLWQDFVLLIYPKVCYHCNAPLVKNESYLCLTCIVGLPTSHYWEDHSNPVYRSFPYLTRLKSANCFLKYSSKGISGSILHHLKYNDQYQLGVYFGILYAKQLQRDEYMSSDFIIPVPLHPKKEKQRGYNQSLAIAEGISQVLGIPIDMDIVARNKYKISQTKKGRIDRWINLKNIYRITSTEKVIEKEIILVDDVITTGATIGHLAETLETAGARSLHILSLASGK